jgi:hypothetical protein
MAQATESIFLRLPVDEATALDTAIARVEVRLERKVTRTEMIRTLLANALKDERAVARVGK